MKKYIQFFAALLLISGSLKAQDITPISIGSPMPKPDQMFKTAAGGAGTVASEKKENGTLVVFSCNTCPYVIKSESRIREMMDITSANGVGMVIINSNEAKRETDDSYEKMKEYAAAQKYSCTYAIDGGSILADVYGATRTPEFFLFDKNNKLVYHGAIDDSPADASAAKNHYLADAVKALKSGKKIKVTETKSVGCSIKRVSK